MPSKKRRTNFTPILLLISILVLGLVGLTMQIAIVLLFAQTTFTNEQLTQIVMFTIVAWVLTGFVVRALFNAMMHGTVPKGKK